jgi:chemotaxis receptor (MCP) glutamine deamidase CheD
MKRELTHDTYITVDMVVSLVLASCCDIRLSDIAEKVISLKKAIPFELKHSGRNVFTNEEVRKAVRELLDEGLREGWIETVFMLGQVEGELL